MSNITETQQNKAAQDSATNEFAKLLEESFEINQINEGKIVKGTVVSIESDLVIVDVGLKTEGRISLSEFSSHDGSHELEIGDQVDVYLERIENALGDAVLSRDKAKREENWVKLEEDQKNNVIVEGIINGKVRGGFTVDINGTQAFLPGSQVDIRPIKDIRPFMNKPQSFHILKMDKKRGNIVVSRKSVLSDNNSLDKSEILNKLDEGQEIEGIVKNITDYGAFVDLGGVDGLLHVTDISWKRINKPSEAINIGDKVKVKIIKISKEDMKISLGMKHLLEDPWVDSEKKYIVGDTGAGYAGKMLSMAAKKFGLKCKIFMGAKDIKRQKPNCDAMRKNGAEIIPVTTGSQTLVDAVSECMRYWVSNCDTTHMCVGSTVGPNIFIKICAWSTAQISRELMVQVKEEFGKIPKKMKLLNCVGGGSSAMGFWNEFMDTDAEFVGIEAGGPKNSKLHAAPLTNGSKIGILHGAAQYVVQDKEGQIGSTDSISAGLDYPGISPLHCFLKDTKRARYTSASDEEALKAYEHVSKLENISPSLEPSHAFAEAIKIAPKLKSSDVIVVNSCGDSIKDKDIIKQRLGSYIR